MKHLDMLIRFGKKAVIVAAIAGIGLSSACKNDSGDGSTAIETPVCAYDSTILEDDDNCVAPVVVKTIPQI